MTNEQRLAILVLDSFLDKHNDNSQEKILAEFIKDSLGDDGLEHSVAMCDELMDSAARIKRDLLRSLDKNIGGQRYSVATEPDGTYDTFDEALEVLGASVQGHDDAGRVPQVSFHQVDADRGQDAD